MKKIKNQLPDKEGWYKWTDYNSFGELETIEIEVYTRPYGGLFVWCNDAGVPGGPDIQNITIGDEMCSHLPVLVQGGTWEYISPLD